MKILRTAFVLALTLLGVQSAYAQATLLPPGQMCLSASTGITGSIGLLGTITGGSGYTAGTYGGVTLTGGSGSGATANITVAGGVVTGVAILNPGTQYVVGDVLSASAATIGGTGAGFSFPVASIGINSNLAGGKVGFYVPNTLTFKTTWRNASQTTPNTNPLTLDANGCAVVYGVGSYRQIVKDSLGNTIWDAVTTAPVIPSSAATSGAGDFLAIGSIIPIAGFSAPTNYALAYGQAISRVTYADAFAAITISGAASCTTGSATVGGITTTAQMRAGAAIEAGCLTPGTTVASIAGPNSVTVSSPAISTGATTMRVFNYGNGNGSSTFNLPDLRGRVLPGADGMGGTTAGRLTSTYYGASPTPPGAASAAPAGESRTLVLGNLPPYTPAGTNTKPNITISGGTIASTLATGIDTPGGNSPLGNALIAATLDNAPVFSGTAQGGTSVPFSIVQPSITINYAIKILNGTIPSVGVLSFGGMTGDILCGANLTCASQQVSLATALNFSGTTVTGGSFAGGAITGGTINSTTIGATTPSTGNFTSLSINGVPVGTSTDSYWNLAAPDITNANAGKVNINKLVTPGLTGLLVGNDTGLVTVLCSTPHSMAVRYLTNWVCGLFGIFTPEMYGGGPAVADNRTALGDMATAVSAAGSGHVIYQTNATYTIMPLTTTTPSGDYRIQSFVNVTGLTIDFNGARISTPVSSALAVSLSQSRGSAGNLVINGTTASLGVATFAAAEIVVVQSFGNDTGITFTITGTDAVGAPLVEAITGASSGYAKTIGLFKTVTQVATSGATASTVVVGFSRIILRHISLINVKQFIINDPYFEELNNVEHDFESGQLGIFIIDSSQQGIINNYKQVGGFNGIHCTRNGPLNEEDMAHSISMPNGFTQNVFVPLALVKNCNYTTAIGWVVLNAARSFQIYNMHDVHIKMFSNANNQYQSVLSTDGLTAEGERLNTTSNILIEYDARPALGQPGTEVIIIGSSGDDNTRMRNVRINIDMESTDTVFTAGIRLSTANAVSKLNRTFQNIVISGVIRVNTGRPIDIFGDDNCTGAIAQNIVLENLIINSIAANSVRVDGRCLSGIDSFTIRNAVGTNVGLTRTNMPAGSENYSQGVSLNSGAATIYSSSMTNVAAWYQYRPGGILQQGGTVSAAAIATTTVNFPVAYRATPAGGGACGTAGVSGTFNYIASTTQILINRPDGATTCTFNWNAIGQF